MNTKEYYKGDGSLYKFALQRDLDAYQFDIIKRIVRCKLKGKFLEDLQKTKDVIEIYIEEQFDINNDKTKDDKIYSLNEIEDILIKWTEEKNNGLGLLYKMFYELKGFEFSGNHHK